jgi:hypothetical protein
MKAIYNYIMGQPDFMVEVADSFARVMLAEIVCYRPIGLCVEPYVCKRKGRYSCPYANTQGVF